MRNESMFGSSSTRRIVLVVVCDSSASCSVSCDIVVLQLFRWIPHVLLLSHERDRQSVRKQSVIHACGALAGVSRVPTIWNSSTVGEQVRREIRAESLTRSESCFSMEGTFCSAPNTTWRGVLSVGRKCQESLHGTWSGCLSWSVV